MNTWWVHYTFEYEYFNNETEEWEQCCDGDARRFHCTKKNIKEEVTKHIVTYELQGEQYRNLLVTINDKYITTDSEV